jgi:hypothetical protein
VPLCVSRAKVMQWGVRATMCVRAVEVPYMAMRGPSPRQKPAKELSAWIERTCENGRV